ncbi:MAG: hypothetical protein AAF511_00420 [Pseudomonadota bacterium]
MRRNSIFFALLFSVLAGCTATTAVPDGVTAYHQNDWARATALLTKPAARGDAEAQLYLALIGLQQSPSQAPNDSALRDYLVSSASSGSYSAYGVLLWLNADGATRDQWLARYRSRPEVLRPPADDRGLIRDHDGPFIIDRQPLGVMETAAGGPLPYAMIDALYPLVDASDQEATLWREITLDTDDFLTVDLGQARLGLKEAQTRLAMRHETGRGVAVDHRRAMRLLHTAASPSAGTQHCADQASIDDVSDFVLCAHQHRATTGLPAAQFKLCQAYAFGELTKKDEDQAEYWCNRAIQSERFRRLARDVLIQMNVSELAQ